MGIQHEVIEGDVTLSTGSVARRRRHRVFSGHRMERSWICGSVIAVCCGTRPEYGIEARHPGMVYGGGAISPGYNLFPLLRRSQKSTTYPQNGMEHGR